MREIKLRSYDKRKKEFKYLFLCYPCGSVMDLQEPSRHQDYSYWQQYTGIKDKEGCEIYEGDILQCGIGDGKGVAVVKWYSKHARFIAMNALYNFLIDFKNIKIVGNIYENPELLE